MNLSSREGQLSRILEEWIEEEQREKKAKEGKRPTAARKGDISGALWNENTWPPR